MIKQLRETDSFRSYLYLNKIMVKDASEQIGYNPVYVSSILCGRNKYGKKIAKEIERFTGGKIKANDIAGKYEGR